MYYGDKLVKYLKNNFYDSKVGVSIMFLQSKRRPDAFIPQKRERRFNKIGKKKKDS